MGAKQILIFMSWVVFAQISLAEALELPKSFTNGEVAEASDFNDNYSYLLDKVSTLQQNSAWKNAGASGTVKIEVNCTADPAALIEAYQSNLYRRYISLELEGDCYGAYHWVQIVDEAGEPALDQVQPMNQVVQIYPKEGTTARLIPRTIKSGIDTYATTSVLSSFGNGLYITGIEIQMGSDDSRGVLFSRSSNGDLTNVVILGASGASNQRGVQIQNGAAAYVGNTTITGVARGIYMQGGATGNLYGSLQVDATEAAISVFNGGVFTLSLGDDGALTGDIVLNRGVEGFINNTAGATFTGSLSLNSSSLAIYGGTDLSNVSAVDVNNSNLDIWHATSGLTLDKATCHGVSSFAVNGQEVRNQENNGCLDQGGWNQLISGETPSTSGQTRSALVSKPNSSNKASEGLAPQNQATKFPVKESGYRD